MGSLLWQHCCLGSHSLLVAPRPCLLQCPTHCLPAAFPGSAPSSRSPQVWEVVTNLNKSKDTGGVINPVTQGRPPS